MNPVEVTCAVKAGKRLSVELRVHNRGRAPVHVPIGERMPYVLRDPDGGLVVLQGVNPPDPAEDYPIIEIPLTRALAPGQHFTRKVTLTPLKLSDHYGEETENADLHGEQVLRCRVGWGEQPIVAADRPRLSLKKLLAWQKLAEAPPLRIKLP